MTPATLLRELALMRSDAVSNGQLERVKACDVLVAMVRQMAEVVV